MCLRCSSIVDSNGCATVIAYRLVVACAPVQLPSAMSTALELYQGVVRSMNAGIGMQPSRKDELVASQRVHLVTVWSRLSTITPNDSSAVLEALGGDTDPFPRDVRESLAGALLDIVTSGSASSASSEVRVKNSKLCRFCIGTCRNRVGAF